MPRLSWRAWLGLPFAVLAFLGSALWLSVAGLREINPAETVLFSGEAHKARRCGEMTV